ncbi:MAG TPA: hypothetical protein VJ843_04285 [Candidatus Saccharimonadales bacterium]|nr:hypothetical protein [Candidatus Saccharimonadales bacterium]
MSASSPLTPLDGPTKPWFTRMSKKTWFICGILLGALIILAIRFAIYNPQHTHYHANFAVYINDQREEFKDPTYYEDVAACTQYDNMTPAERAHMHNNVNDVIHVHDNAVTWGQFFENIGWYLGDDFIKTRDHMYVASGNQKLHLLLNGQDYTGLASVSNMVIGDQDKLLISFGDISSNRLKMEYAGISNNAKKADETHDPASCSGHQNATASERLKHLF